MTVKLVGSSSGSVSLAAPASTTGGANIEFKLPVVDGSANQLLKTDGSGQLSFASDVNIDSSGNVGIGTTSPACDLHVSAANPRARFTSTGNTVNYDIFMGSTTATVGTSSNHDTVFMTNDAERMRLNSTGHLSVGTTNTSPGQGDGNTDVGTVMNKNGRFICNSAGSFSSFGRNDTGTVISFTRSGGDQGSIGVAVGSVSYNTSSDYRLKENITSISDGITRLKTLKPLRFNFIEDTTNTLRDGFLAHEVTAVPEAITGTKDEVDSDNKPVYQGIDQSKLVPLLTAALQEAVAKIETLETKVAALEAK